MSEFEFPKGFVYADVNKGPEGPIYHHLIAKEIPEGRVPSYIVTHMRLSDNGLEGVFSSEKSGKLLSSKLDDKIYRELTEDEFTDLSKRFQDYLQSEDVHESLIGFKNSLTRTV